MSIAYRPEREQSIYSSELLKKVQTIGYRQQGSLAEIEHIMADLSTILVDIRLSPRSENLQWTKTAFSKKYQKRYVWIKQLGNLNYNKENAPIEIADPQAGIERLLELLQEHNVLLLCGCEDYKQCHRKTVYDLLDELISVPISKRKEVFKTEQLEATCFSEFYVDDIWEYPDCKLASKQWCHLATSGSVDDLHAFAQKLKLKKSWFQDKPNYPHYDLTPGKRAAAIKHGALAVNHSELVKICFPKLIEICSTPEQDDHRLATLPNSTPLAGTLPNDADPQMLVRMVLDQDQTIQVLQAENTSQREERAELIELVIEKGLAQDEEEIKEIITTQRSTIDTRNIDTTRTRLSRNASEIQQQPALPGYNQRNESINSQPSEDHRTTEGNYRRSEGNDGRLRENVTNTKARLSRSLESTTGDIRNLILTALNCINTLEAAYNHNYQEIEIIHKLESNPKIKPNQITPIRKIIDLALHSSQRDEEGKARILAQKVAKLANVSDSTGARAIKFVETQLPELFDSTRHTERTQTGETTEIFYGKVKPEGLQNLATIEPIVFKQQGGDKYICARCGSKHVRIKTIRVRTVVCDECNHESPPIDDDPVITYEHPNASYQKQDISNNTAKPQNGYKNDAIIITSNPPSVCADTIPAAARLLLEIAGQHDEHITMPRKHEKKYLEVHRPLEINDLISHLKGGEARGASCKYENDQTRLLCWDADDITDWTILQEAAQELKQHGYIPLLEESPADRGGHLLIISDALVNGTVARQRVYSFCPELEKAYANSTEYWPAPPDAKKWNRIRLPGGFYTRLLPEPVKGWCKIINVSINKTSHDGESAAALLLASLTPATIIAPASAIHRQDQQENPPASVEQQHKAEARTSVREQPPTAREQRFLDLEHKLGYTVPRVDEKWEKDNGFIETTTLYFAIMNNVAIRWFNEHNTLESIRPLESNGMALSPNGNERTASTSYHSDGERWTDHSQHGKRADGTHDSGDALELACKVWGKPKWQIISETRKEMINKARPELESAARAGEDIPDWLECPVCIITPRGRQEYIKLLREGKNGERRSVDQLGTGSNNLPEGSRDSVRVSEPIRGDHRDAEEGARRQPERLLESNERDAGHIIRHRSEPYADRGAETKNNQSEQQHCNASEQSQRTKEETPRRDTTTQEDTGNTTKAIEAKRNIAERPAAPTKSKIGTCLVTNPETGKPCGSTRWIPNAEEEYVCANMNCLSPIAWTRRIEATNKTSFFPTHDNTKCVGQHAK